MERRKSPRYSVEVPARLSVAGEPIDARLREICRDAILLEADRSFPLDTEAAIAVALPGTGVPVDLRARVIRLAEPEAGGVSLMALLFTDLAPHVATQIELFLESQEPPAA